MAATVYTPGPSIGIEDVPLASHGLKIDGVRGIGFDLASEAVYLNVDGAFVAGDLVARKLVALDRCTAPLGELAQEITLALGELHGLFVALQFTAPNVENE